MVNIVMYTEPEELEALTELSHDELWDAGFNLDDTYRRKIMTESEIEELKNTAMRLSGEVITGVNLIIEALSFVDQVEHADWYERASHYCSSPSEVS